MLSACHLAAESLGHPEALVLVTEDLKSRRLQAHHLYPCPAHILGAGKGLQEAASFPASAST